MAENNEMQPENKNQGSNKTTILIILILLLVGVNIWLYWKLNSKSQTVATQNTLIVKDSTEYAALDTKYSTALKDIESLKNQNGSLDSLLDKRENDIKNMKAALETAHRNNTLSKKDYEKKEKELDDLITDLKAQITQLEKEKNILVAQKDSLGNNLSKETATNAQLTDQNKTLGKKAQMGALLKPQNMVVTGVRIKGSGKESTTTNAKKSDKIKVTFDVDENKVSDPGTKTFLLRLVGPGGTTLNVQSAGSGSFDLADGGGKIEYTISKDITYNQTKQGVTIYWAKTGEQFEKGKYTAEVYQDGYKVGSKDFQLK